MDKATLLPQSRYFIFDINGKDNILILNNMELLVLCLLIMYAKIWKGIGVGTGIMDPVKTWSLTNQSPQIF